MEEMQEAAVQRQGGARLKKGGKRPLIIIGIVLAALAAAYVGLCAWAAGQTVFYPNWTINGVDVAGLSVDEAQQKLEQELPQRVVPIYEDTGSRPYTEADTALTPLATITLAELGFSPDAVDDDCAVALSDWAQDCMDQQRGQNFLKQGYRYLQSLGSGGGAWYGFLLNGSTFDGAVESLTAQLDEDPVDASYTLEEDNLSITKARDGRSVDQAQLRETLENAGSVPCDPDHSQGAYVPFTTVPAKTMTAQEIHDATASGMKNATYDAATDTILPEQAGAEFDVTAAQEALDAAQPGETVSVPAEVQLPTVTAEDLKALLFRDVLGEARTKVGGTSARKSNVKLSAAAINEYVMNPGDVFSYNGVVGKRTAERGYKPAPAYVQGETVDEIGGGICQTSSTLYLACLRSNLEITERYAHRYIPSYITAGMDATVSWGGPDYKFTNDTNYPIKIVTSYEGSYLTVKILGTNIDGTSVKMTNEFISSTPFEVIYEDDPTLAPGTEKVKTTPYTGYKYKTYRNVYDANGKLISSEYEATSDYKSRNKVILRGPAVEEPDTPAVNPGEITDPSQSGGETSGTPTTPTDPNGTTPTEPGGTTTPSEPDGGTTPPSGSTPEEPPLIVVET